jgi:hypothetical protein
MERGFFQRNENFSQGKFQRVLSTYGKPGTFSKSHNLTLSIMIRALYPVVDNK